MPTQHQHAHQRRTERMPTNAELGFEPIYIETAYTDLPTNTTIIVMYVPNSTPTQPTQPTQPTHLVGIHPIGADLMFAAEIFEFGPPPTP